jgi:hypothetical protein
VMASMGGTDVTGWYHNEEQAPGRDQRRDKARSQPPRNPCCRRSDCEHHFRVVNGNIKSIRGHQRRAPPIPVVTADTGLTKDGGTFCTTGSCSPRPLVLLEGRSSTDVQRSGSRTASSSAT